MQQNILITGTPGAGKTTAILRVLSRLGRNRAGGFWSIEIREHSRRVGFAIETTDNKRGTLAHISMESGPRVGRYRVSIKDIDEVAVPSMRAARRSQNFIIIDEIAKMELFSAAFRDEVFRCIDTARVIGTVQARRSQVLDEIRSREDVRVLELNLENRDEIPDRVIQLAGIT
jgi:nucleoside-triphosphatase